jgi:hypothetical protein
MRRRWLLPVVVLLGVVVWGYVHTHPLVFMPAHTHCIKFASLQMLEYADTHDGAFPSHPKGYPNALLLMNEDGFYSLTGPGYDAAPFHEAKRAAGELSEAKCGRVYVQGLTRKSNPELALLFDKLPTPGGDHSHLPVRLWAPPGREVLLVAGHFMFVRESKWPEFARNQVELLVQEGFERHEAESLYGTRPE